LIDPKENADNMRRLAIYGWETLISMTTFMRGAVMDVQEGNSVRMKVQLSRAYLLDNKTKSICKRLTIVLL